MRGLLRSAAELATHGAASGPEPATLSAKITHRVHAAEGSGVLDLEGCAMDILPIHARKLALRFVSFRGNDLAALGPDMAGLAGLVLLDVAHNKARAALLGGCWGERGGVAGAAACFCCCFLGAVGSVGGRGCRAAAASFVLTAPPPKTPNPP